MLVPARSSVEPASTCTVPVLATVSPLTASRLSAVASSLPLLLNVVMLSRSSSPPLASSSPPLLIVLGSIVSLPPVDSRMPVEAMVMAALLIELPPVESSVPALAQNAAGNGRALQIQERAGVDLNRRAAGVRHRDVLQIQRTAGSRQQLAGAGVGHRAGMDDQRAVARLQQIAGADGNAVERAAAGRIRRPGIAQGAAADARAGQVQRRAGIDLHRAGVGDGVAVERQQAVGGRQQLAAVAERRDVVEVELTAIGLQQPAIVDRAGVDRQLAAGRFQDAGLGDGDGGIAVELPPVESSVPASLRMPPATAALSRSRTSWCRPEPSRRWVRHRDVLQIQRPPVVASSLPVPALAPSRNG